MFVKKLGRPGAKAIVLLHGGGLSWWNYRKAAEILSEDFEIYLPVLDGHAGSGCPYTGIRDNARKIVRWIGEELGGGVYLLGGLSLGGQTALEILAAEPDIAEYALIESASVAPSGITAALTGPALACSYGLIKNKSFAKIQARSLRIPPDLFEEYFRDTRAISRSDMAAFIKASALYGLNQGVRGTKAKVRVFAGSKETRGVLRSARMIRRAIPGSELTVLPGLRHGEFSLGRPEEFAEYIKNINKAL